ncbi:hypothetical protein BUALT_Bualt11G0043400 [Buddleja alternifolia]|uniref:Retroviral polymerase SH3-like domain-containing protein n=1 Tax=Buddleja alternifolia TaxID=168488 RepID=A0AAV6X0Z1_9LAMI|nr:hypothetical protein BUALT_Bualt11G0043400 [Buddleja alternifolia]
MRKTLPSGNFIFRILCKVKTYLVFLMVQQKNLLMVLRNPVKNAKVVTWLLTSVAPEIGMGLRSFRYASEMWTHLNFFFTQSSHARYFQIERELSEYVQGYRDIHSFYSGIINLWSAQDMLSQAKLSPTVLANVIKDRAQTRHHIQLRSLVLILVVSSAMSVMNMGMSLVIVAYIDTEAIQKIVQDSMAAALPGAISSALTVATFSGKKLNPTWHIDSAASNHMTDLQTGRTGRKHRSLFLLQFEKSLSHLCFLSASSSDIKTSNKNWVLWHRRLVKERDKLSSKASKCDFIGNADHQKGYQCYDPINRRIRVSRHNEETDTLAPMSSSDLFPASSNQGSTAAGQNITTSGILDTHSLRRSSRRPSIPDRYGYSPERYVESSTPALGYKKELAMSKNNVRAKGRTVVGL